MRRIITAISGAALALSLVAQAIPAQAAVAGYDSSYAGESAFLTLAPGASGTFTVFFLNTGTTTWTRGTSTQVDLAACLEDKTTCNAQDATEAPFNSGWLSATKYATSTQTSVAPGQVGTFTYNVAVPAAQAGGTHRFNGALVKADTNEDVRNEGYYQDVLVTGAAAAPSGIVVTPTDSATLSTSSGTGTTNQNRGARSFTATVATSVTGTCVDIALITSARPSTDGTRFRDTEGTTSTADDNLQADDLGGTSAAIEVVQGVSTGNDAATAIHPTAADYVDCVTIPANRTITFTIDSATPGQSVRPVVFVDTDSDNALDLTGVNDADGRKATSETAGVGGTTLWVAGLATSTGAQQTGTVCRKDADANLFSVDIASTSTADPNAASCDISYVYDANDDFFVEGVPSTLETFEAAISRGDAVDVGPYAADAAARSTFRITTDRPGTPAVSCSVQSGNSVRYSITPSGPGPLSYYSSFVIQRATAGSTSYTTIAQPTSDAETGSTSTFEYTQTGEPAGTWDYRVRGVVDGDTGNNTAASCASVVVGTPGTSTRPLSTDLFISTSGGLTGQLDTGDVFKVVFDQVMNPDSAGDVILVQDADGTTMTIRCSGEVGATPVGEYEAICNFNATDETVKGAPQTANKVLTVTLIGMALPTATSQAGTVTGMQLPTTVTDQGGITNTAGLQWDPVNSGDRVIDIE